MRDSSDIPILHENDGEILGYIRGSEDSWTARTVFGYVFARVASRQSAEAIVRDQGRLVIKGMWQYLDADHRWYPCIIKEAYENRVIVIRTNELGFEEHSTYKLVTIKDPSETNLQKA